jgi:hypothetical protein
MKFKKIVEDHAPLPFLKISNTVRLNELVTGANPHPHTGRTVSARKFSVRIVEGSEATASAHLQPLLLRQIFTEKSHVPPSDP